MNKILLLSRNIFTPSLIFILIPVTLLMLAGLMTISSYEAGDVSFLKQLVSVLIGLLVLITASCFSYRALRESRFVVLSYVASLIVLVTLFVIGHTSKGATSWLTYKGLSFQPVDISKLVVIILLAKYFTKRHIEIARIRHIIASFLYALIPAILVYLQPDLGGALVIMGIWVVMVLVSGIKIKHIAMLLVLTSCLSFAGWQYVFKSYQKDRILNVFDPMRDPKGSGYNVIQSLVAIGSGGLYGKGVGYGTQSRLKYLPEYKTDFIFAAFVEEWGMIGGVLVMTAFLIIIYKLSTFATFAETNFEALFTFGVMGWIMVHVLESIGMNLGIAPVTGIPLPFMSYGGSHLVAECLAVGMCLGMYRSSKNTHRFKDSSKFLGEV